MFSMYKFNWMFLMNLMLMIMCSLICIAFFTIAESKIMASIQSRKGPNVVGLFGLLQPIADGLKLLIKEMIIPLKSSWKLFLIAPLLVLSLSFLTWAMLPFTLEWDNSLTKLEFIGKHQYQYLNIDKYWLIINEWFAQFDFTGHSSLTYGILVLLAISSLNVYGIIIAGWSSYSKYAFFGALRSAAQMMSYEVSIMLVLLPIMLLSGTLNLIEIVWAQMHSMWYIMTLFPTFLLFLISMIAETNSAPFDLPEAEAELVAGYNVEYAAMIFAMFFLGEYSNMLLMSVLMTMLFLGGWSFYFVMSAWMAMIIFISKILIFCYMYMLVRASLPSYRYDQLMDIGWKIFLPWSMSFLWMFLIYILQNNYNLYQLEIFNEKNLTNDFFLTSSSIQFN